MMDLEDRVRNTLSELADTVPPSAHPRGDLERRLAGRHTTRRPVLAIAAAAAVVVAGVAVPVALNRGDDAATTRVATAPPPPSSAPVDITPGLPLATFTENGVTESAEFVPTADDQWCVSRTSPPDHKPITGQCVQVPSWPFGPDGMGYVETWPILGGNTIDSGPLPYLKVFVTAPEVATLEVRSGDGSPVDVRLLHSTGRAHYYRVDFGGSSQGFGFTAKDASGTVLQDAIT